MLIARIEEMEADQSKKVYSDERTSYKTLNHSFSHKVEHELKRISREVETELVQRLVKDLSHILDIDSNLKEDSNNP